jgi:hypothetical protein
MQINATDVFQPVNPGDALIRSYEILGPAPEPKWLTLDGLQLAVTPDFSSGREPAFVVEIRNSSDSTIKVDPSSAAPVLVSDRPEWPLAPSDGGSLAVITRTDLTIPSSSQEESLGDQHYRWGYSTDWKGTRGEPLEFRPGQSFKTRITFRVPPGRYQFMFAYGGGVHEEKSLVSNSISFDVSDKHTVEMAD